jgi:hypothetical protein
MNPPEKQFSVEPRSVKSKFLSVGAGVMNAFARPKLALLWAAAFVSLAPFHLSAQETRKDAVVKVPPALEAAIAESHEALRKILNGDPSGYAALFADRDDITLGNPFGPFGKGRAEVLKALKAVFQVTLVIDAGLTAISNARVVRVTPLPGAGKKEIVFADTMKMSTYLVAFIVGEFEADVKKGKISISSPIARALIGKAAGDTVEVSAPGGARSYEILKVQFA